MNTIKWNIINGKVNTEFGLEYRTYAYDSAILESNIKLRSGKISFNMQLDSQDSDRNMCFSINLDNDIANEHLNIFFYSNGNISVFEENKNTNKMITSTYNNLNYKILNNYKRIENDIIIEINGSIINIYKDNNIVLNISKSTNSLVQVNAHFEGKGFAMIKKFYIEEMKTTAFVIMEFSQQFTPIYTDIIKPTCDERGILCVRADEIERPGNISKDVLDLIEQADIIIAEISPINANVYFEIGYASAYKKNIIFLKEDTNKKLPFDISTSRVIYYQNSISGALKVKETLSRYLNYLKNGERKESIYKEILMQRQMSN